MLQPKLLGPRKPPRSLFVADLLFFGRIGEPASAPASTPADAPSAPFASIWQVPVVRAGWVPAIGSRWTPAHQLMFNMGNDSLLSDALATGKPSQHSSGTTPLAQALVEFSELQAWMATVAPHKSECALTEAALQRAPGVPPQGHDQAIPWENPSCTWSHQSSRTASSTPNSSSAAAPPLAHS